MTQVARWGWVLLFLLVAALAVQVNVHRRRVFILHEGQASQPATRAFFRGIDAILQQQPRINERSQFLGSDPDACRQALSQLRAFQPDAVIAEGLQAHRCIAREASGAALQPLTQPALNDSEAARAAFIAAWATVLADLAPPAGAVTLVQADDRDAWAESDLLAAAARKAGLELRLLVVATGAELRAGLQGEPDEAVGLVIVGHTVDQDAENGQDLALRALFSTLRAATALPIVATRLDSVRLGADLALAQAPEQRGEQLAYGARHGRTLDASGPAQPLEMAVGLHADFANRWGARLPSFYSASARLAGLLYEPHKSHSP